MMLIKKFIKDDVDLETVRIIPDNIDTSITIACSTFTCHTCSFYVDNEWVCIEENYTDAILKIGGNGETNNQILG